jgi:hypothetical protein
MHYRSFAIGLLCSAFAACSSSPGDEGTYHLTITLDAQTSSPLNTLPSTLSWPAVTEFTLQLEDETKHVARIEIFGEPVDADATRLEHPVDPTMAPGTLLLTFGSAFRVTVEDTVACPQRNPPSLHGSTALYILNGHIRGQTTDDEACSLPDPIPYARFFFDIAGDRAKE